MKTLDLPRPAHIDGLERYEPGKPIEEVQRELGLRRVVKLASNENPLGPSPAAVAGAHAVLASVHRYPDGPGFALRQALARRHKLEPSQIVLGNGSTDLIDLLARAYLAPGDNAVIAEEAFARFRQCVNARNGGARLVPMREHTHDLEAMAAAVDARTRLVFVANPNNPTGTWNTRAQLEALLERLGGDVLVVLDEAYFEYAEHPDYPSGARLRPRRGSGRGAAHLLQGLRPGRPAGGLRPGGHRRSPSPSTPSASRSTPTSWDRPPPSPPSRTRATSCAASSSTGSRRRGSNGRCVTRGLRVLPSLANFLCVDVGRRHRPSISGCSPRA